MPEPSASNTLPKNPEIARLENEIAALKRQWPRHSVPPALLMRLEELEDELAEARSKQERGESGAKS